MADSSPNDYATVIGPDVTIKGELSFEKGMRLHGRMEGKITTPGRLHVAKEAKVQADVEAGAIIIEGEVHGNLLANDRVEMKNTTRYEGDLTAAKLVVDEGAVFRGHVTVGPDATKNRAPGVVRPAGVSMPAAQPQGQPVK